MRLLVFASGRGSNFKALLDATKKGEIKARICGLVCDKNCPAEEIAKSNSVPVSIIRPNAYLSREEYIDELLNTVKNYSPDHILLAGYMRILPTELIDEYPLGVINVHPSMLPAFQGKDAILQAWKAGVKTTGVTIHFVNDKLDQGVIIAQQEVKVPGSIEELEAEIHKVEHKLYVDTVKSLVEEPFDTFVVSKCLLGENCRYDGRNKYSSRASKLAASFKGNVIAVCPELDCGLGVPRPASEILNGRLVTQQGMDLTDTLRDFSLEFISEDLHAAKKILAVLKEKSPSCGRTKVNGIFTRTLMEKLKSKILVVTEEEL
jgi:phosphoribosylglycinamide formyltransferase-1